MIVDLKYDREGYLRRWCPICGRMMLFHEFEIMPGDNISLSVWEDERLSIPCCNCYKLITFFMDYEVIGDVIDKMFNCHDIIFKNKLTGERVHLLFPMMIYNRLKELSFLNG